MEFDVVPVAVFQRFCEPYGLQRFCGRIGPHKRAADRKKPVRDRADAPIGGHLRCDLRRSAEGHQRGRERGGHRRGAGRRRPAARPPGNAADEGPQPGDDEPVRHGRILGDGGFCGRCAYCGPRRHARNRPGVFDAQPCRRASPSWSITAAVTTAISRTRRGLL